jgi:CheY-like chemotaxis protein
MANILLVDPDPVAQQAMKGILARGSHRFAAVGSLAAARDFLYRNAPIDLVFLELVLGEEETGLTLIQELRRDCLLQTLPIAVYTTTADRDSVQQALALRLQNFLVKPYTDAAVFAEVNKALARPWRDALSVPEKLLCAQLGLPPLEARARRRAFLETLAVSVPNLCDLAAAHNRVRLLARLEHFAGEAIGLGANALVTFLEHLQTLAEGQKWTDLARDLARLETVPGLLCDGNEHETVPAGFIASEARCVNG